MASSLVPKAEEMVGYYVTRMIVNPESQREMAKAFKHDELGRWHFITNKEASITTVE